MLWKEKGELLYYSWSTHLTVSVASKCVVQTNFDIPIFYYVYMLMLLTVKTIIKHLTFNFNLSVFLLCLYLFHVMKLLFMINISLLLNNWQIQCVMNESEKKPYVHDFNIYVDIRFILMLLTAEMIITHQLAVII